MTVPEQSLILIITVFHTFVRTFVLMVSAWHPLDSTEQSSYFICAPLLHKNKPKFFTGREENYLTFLFALSHYFYF